MWHHRDHGLRGAFSWISWRVDTATLQEGNVFDSMEGKRNAAKPCRFLRYILVHWTRFSCLSWTVKSLVCSLVCTEKQHFWNAVDSDPNPWTTPNGPRDDEWPDKGWRKPWWSKQELARNKMVGYIFQPQGCGQENSKPRNNKLTMGVWSQGSQSIVCNKTHLMS